MQISAGILFWGLFISLIGFVFLRYGKKNSDFLSIVTGIILMVYPYLVTSLGWSILTGVAICALFFFLKRVVNL